MLFVKTGKRILIFLSSVTLVLAEVFLIGSYPANAKDEKDAVLSETVNGDYAGEIEINEESFPDTLFREYVLSDINTSDGDLADKEVLTERECGSVDIINVSGMNIESLRGIEYFPMLEVLFCNSNKIGELDLSANTKLIDLFCSDNVLTDIKLPECLQYADISGNLLYELDTEHCTELVTLLCSENSLSSISLGSSIEELDLFDNQLCSIDLGGSPKLRSLNVGKNRLTVLELSAQKKLSEINAELNSLCCLDLTGVGSETSLGGCNILNADNNCLEVSYTDGVLDLSYLPNGFDPSRVLEWRNAEVEGSILTVSDISEDVSYLYYVGTSVGGSDCVLFTLTDKDSLVSEFDIITENVDYFTPKAGQSSYRNEDDYSKFLSRGEKFSVYDAYWNDLSNEEIATRFCSLDEEGFIFKGDTVYQLCLRLKTNGYYVFSEDNTENYMLNGKACDEWYFNDECDILLCYNMPKTEQLSLRLIPSLDIVLSDEDFPSPEAGTLAFRDSALIYSSLEGKNIRKVSYYWGDGSFAYAEGFYSEVDGFDFKYAEYPLFSENSTYSLCLKLSAECGYEFSDGFLITLNAKAPDKIVIDRVRDETEMLWVFKTKELPKISQEERYITESDFTLSEDSICAPVPKESVMRDFSVLEQLDDGKKFTVFGAMWGYVKEENGRLDYITADVRYSEECFLENTKYYLSICLLASAGYRFDKDKITSEDFTLNGKGCSERYVGKDDAVGLSPYEIYGDGQVLILHYEYGKTGIHICSFDIDSNDDTHHFKICKCTKVLESTREEHHGGIADCIFSAVCTVCKTPFGNKDPERHANTGFIYEGSDGGTHIKKHLCCAAVADAKEACLGEAGGCDERAVCTLCGNAYGDKVPHILTELKSDGTDHDGVCTVCKEEIREAHTYGEDGICTVCEYGKDSVLIITVENGSINGSGSDTLSVNKNSSVTVKADKAEDGKVFKGWNVNGEMVSTSEVYTFKADKSTVLSAVYENAPKSEVSPAAVALTVIGVFAVLAAAGFFIYLIVKKRKKSK